MENRDFRDRLKNHTREPNPAAWEQMDSLLNSLPSAKNEKKKKRRGFWWFFFGTGIIALILIALITNGSLKFGHSDTALSKIERKEQSGTEDIEIGNVDFSDNTNNEEKKPTSISTENVELKSNDEYTFKTNIEEQNSIEERNEVNIENSGSEMNSEFDLETAENKTDVQENENGKSESKSTIDDNSKRSTLRSEDVSRNLIHRESTAQNVDSAESEDKSVQKPVSNSESSSNEGDLDNEAVIPSESGVDEMDNNLTADTDSNLGKTTKAIEESRAVFLPFSRLILPLKSLQPKEDGIVAFDKEIIIEKPRLFEAFVGGGFARFNDNPGYIIHIGANYGVDRILDLEANIGYSYGSEQGIQAGEPFTFERQFDFNVLVHLNFIKNHMNRFSFFGGLGYAMYSGERVINLEPVNIDVRDHNGRCFHLGFDYKYRFRKYNSLGIRIGAISYDDAVMYTSARFIQEF